MIYRFQNPKFIKSCVRPQDFPFFQKGKEEKPEIAVCGRSNVGKSSLMNHLFSSKKLVKTSSRPGKTQTLNFFSLDEALIFVDLPGYGYAEVPQQIRRQWEGMVRGYFEERKSLHLVLFLLDLKRDPSAQDLAFLDWILHYEKSLIVVFTKVDQVKKSQRKARVDKILKKLQLSSLQHVLYSVKEGIGKHQLMAMIQEAIEEVLD